MDGKKNSTDTMPSTRQFAAKRLAINAEAVQREIDRRDLHKALKQGAFDFTKGDQTSDTEHTIPECTVGHRFPMNILRAVAERGKRDMTQVMLQLLRDAAEHAEKKALAAEKWFLSARADAAASEETPKPYAEWAPPGVVTPENVVSACTTYFERLSEDVAKPFIYEALQEARGPVIRALRNILLDRQLYDLTRSKALLDAPASEVILSGLVLIPPTDDTTSWTSQDVGSMRSLLKTLRKVVARTAVRYRLSPQHHSEWEKAYDTLSQAAPSPIKEISKLDDSLSYRTDPVCLKVLRICSEEMHRLSRHVEVLEDLLAQNPLDRNAP
jgi:hypothetical protein